MKKILLSILISASLLGQTGFAYADDEGFPRSLVYFQIDGEWKVSGYDSGKDYADKMVEVLDGEEKERINFLSTTDYSDEEKTLKIEQIKAETAANKELYVKKGEEADLVLAELKAGAKSVKEAQLNAIDKKASSSFKNTYNPDDPSTSYNANSVTSSLIASSGRESSTPTMQNNNFKVFNELDCSYEEVSNYMDTSRATRTKAFSTSPSYSGAYKAVSTSSSKKIKGKEEDDCQTIFNDGTFDKLNDLSISNLSSSIPSWDDISKKMDDLGNKASEQMGKLAEGLYNVVRQGFCKRLSSDYVGDLAGDLIEAEYKDQTKGTVLQGTKTKGLDKESGQNNFTYKVIKNQSGQSNSNLIKAMDATRNDQAKYQEKFLENELDDYLDGLEDQLFGK